MTKRSSKNSFLWFIFLIYCTVMLWLLFGREFGWNDGISYKKILELNLNTTPLYTIKNYLRVIFKRTNDSVFWHCLINLTGNILLFVPAGYMIPRLLRRMQNFFKFFFSALLTIIIIEVVQLFALLGCCDIDDVILNMTGLTAGYVIWAIFK